MPVSQGGSHHVGNEGGFTRREARSECRGVGLGASRLGSQGGDLVALNRSFCSYAEGQGKEMESGDSLVPEEASL